MVWHASTLPTASMMLVCCCLGRWMPSGMWTRCLSSGLSLAMGCICSMSTPRLLIVVKPLVLGWSSGLAIPGLFVALFNQSTKQFQIALIIIWGLFVDVTKIDQARKSLTWSFGAPSRTRTDTGLILSQLPLPLGYGGLYKAARWPRAQSTALVYKTLSRKGNSGSLNGVLGVYISDD